MSMGIKRRVNRVLMEAIPSAAKKETEKLFERVIGEFSEDPEVNIDRSERKIDIRCRLLGDNDTLRIGIKYEIWKEKDEEGENKRYVVKITSIRIPSRKWFEVLAQKYILGTNFIWYRKRKYWDRVHSVQDEMTWITKVNGRKVPSKRTGKDYFIPNKLFSSNDERKGLDKALYK